MGKIAKIIYTKTDGEGTSFTATFFTQCRSTADHSHKSEVKIFLWHR
jgi:hypothetical protein